MEARNTLRWKRRRGRPSAPLELIAAQVHHLQRRDPARKKESIVAAVCGDRHVKRATVYNALAEDSRSHGHLTSIFAPILNEALPRFQASEKFVAEAKAAYDVARARHRTVCEQLRAEYGPEVLEYIEHMRNWRDKKKRARVLSEIERTIRVAKLLSLPGWTELDELFKIKTLELAPSAVRAAHATP
jgi:hypothetical protein